MLPTPRRVRPPPGRARRLCPQPEHRHRAGGEHPLQQQRPALELRPLCLGRQRLGAAVPGGPRSQSSLRLDRGHLEDQDQIAACGIRHGRPPRGRITARGAQQQRPHRVHGSLFQQAHAGSRLTASGTRAGDQRVRRPPLRETGDDVAPRGRTAPEQPGDVERGGPGVSNHGAGREQQPARQAPASRDRGRDRSVQHEAARAPGRCELSGQRARQRGLAGAGQPAQLDDQRPARGGRGARGHVQLPARRCRSARITAAVSVTTGVRVVSSRSTATPARSSSSATRRQASTSPWR